MQPSKCYVLPLSKHSWFCGEDRMTPGLLKRSFLDDCPHQWTRQHPLKADEETLVHPDHFTDFATRRCSDVRARVPKNQANRSNAGRSSKRRTRNCPFDQARRAISVQKRWRGVRQLRAAATHEGTRLLS